jgi:hypothetical protein
VNKITGSEVDYFEYAGEEKDQAVTHCSWADILYKQREGAASGQAGRFRISIPTHCLPQYRARKPRPERDTDH